MTDDTRTEVSVEVGTSYRWEMESNPTTGYGWYLESDCGLRIEKEFVPRSDLCGAPGVHTFIVSSDTKGTFTLKAEYKRVWENNPPARTNELTITFK